VRHGECAEFVAASGLDAAQREALHAVIERGPLETALTHHVRAHDVELVLVGTHGRSGLMGLLLGSSAARLLDWLPSDTLVMRGA
jgi:nucleotide-binding universal stress UspA family protein